MKSSQRNRGELRELLTSQLETERLRVERYSAAHVLHLITNAMKTQGKIPRVFRQFFPLRVVFATSVAGLWQQTHQSLMSAARLLARRSFNDAVVLKCAARRDTRDCDNVNRLNRNGRATATHRRARVFDENRRMTPLQLYTCDPDASTGISGLAARDVNERARREVDRR